MKWKRAACLVMSLVLAAGLCGLIRGKLKSAKTFGDPAKLGVDLRVEHEKAKPADA